MSPARSLEEIAIELDRLTAELARNVAMLHDEIEHERRAIEEEQFRGRR